MSFPKVSVGFGTGNLLLDIPVIDAITGIIGIAATAPMQGTVFIVNNLTDAENQGFTVANEPVFHRHISEFYAEIGGNQQLYLLGMPAATTMAAMLDYTNANAAPLLLKASNFTIRNLGVFKILPNGYNGGANYIDSDVTAAVTAAGTLVANQNANNNFLRVIIEGRVLLANEASNVILSPSTLTNGAAGIVLGGSVNDGSASIGTALGRKAKYGAHIKVGKVLNGPLALTNAYIGSKNILAMANLEALHDKGYISFMVHPQKAGIYFGIDHMASIDDQRLWAYGCVLDKAAVIAAATFTEQIENDVDVDDNGNITDIDLLHLQDTISQQINLAMSEQMSGDPVVTFTKSNILNTSQLSLKLGIQPKGYTSYISITIGLNA